MHIKHWLIYLLYYLIDVLLAIKFLSETLLSHYEKCCGPHFVEYHSLVGPCPLHILGHLCHLRAHGGFEPHQFKKAPER